MRLRFYEPFTTLSWLAGVTERIRLGTSVLIVPYRHPLLMARMAANLDRFSGGRSSSAWARAGPARSSTRSGCRSSGAGG
ncbi:LLM class flavin-dependent oxidoreductase [Nonomuraea rubra]|uniref:LLM class flavin-dependent oxidoreductase n=1 Tax=Nonomuraea rubra TaxID=46180 RepID=UPI003CD06235